MTPKFPLGQVVATATIAAKMEEHPHFHTGVMQCLDRHVCGDWGLTCEEDIVTNNEALIYGNRVMSAYNIDGERIWIITEADRSSTTVLYPDEY